MLGKLMGATELLFHQPTLVQRPEYLSDEESERGSTELDDLHFKVAINPERFPRVTRLVLRKEE